MKKIIQTILTIVLCAILLSCSDSDILSKDSSNIQITTDSKTAQVWKMSKELNIEELEYDAYMMDAIIDNKLVYDFQKKKGETAFEIKTYNLGNDKIEKIGDYAYTIRFSQNMACADDRFLLFSDSITENYNPNGVFTCVDVKNRTIKKLKEFTAHHYLYTIPIDSENVLCKWAKPLNDEGTDYEHIWEIYNIPANTTKTIMTKEHNSTKRFIESTSIDDGFMYCYAIGEWKTYYLQKYTLDGEMILEIPIDIADFINFTDGTTDSVLYSKVYRNYFYISTLNGRGAIYKFDGSGITKKIFESSNDINGIWEKPYLLKCNGEQEYWQNTGRMLFYQRRTNQIMILNLNTDQIETTLIETDKETIPEFYSSLDEETENYINMGLADRQGNVVLSLVKSDKNAVGGDRHTKYVYYKLSDLFSK